MSTQASFTVKHIAIFDLAVDDDIIHLDVHGVHPEQLKWFNECMVDFEKAQKWIVQEMRDRHTQPNFNLPPLK